MFHLSRKSVVLTAAVCLVLLVAQSASAQRGRAFRLFGTIPAVTLAQLAEVQESLNLTEDQKGQVTQMNQELGDERRGLFQDAAGDFEQLREDIAKLNAEFATKFKAALQEPQQKRMQEIYLQVNGPIVFEDEDIAAALRLSDEQKQKLADAREESRQDAFAAFQDFQNMSDEERATKSSELLASRDKSLLAVLNVEQQQQFEHMKGEKLEVNLDNLPGPGGA